MAGGISFMQRGGSRLMALLLWLVCGCGRVGFETDDQYCGGVLCPQGMECVQGLCTLTDPCSDPQASPPLTEVCDGKDNDCDVLVDEDTSSLAACDTGLEGACAVGEEHCQAAELACLASEIAQTETCNNLDDDCDGVVDEAAADWECGLQAGCVAGSCVNVPDDCGTAAQIGTSAYIECTSPLGWADARLVCQAWGGDLVIVNDATEHSALITLVQSGSLWIGYTDTGFPINEFHWVDDSDSDFTVWCSGEPANFLFGEETEDCAAMQNCDSTKGWNDLPCSWVHSYLCERPPAQ